MFCILRSTHQNSHWIQPNKTSLSSPSSTTSHWPIFTPGQFHLTISAQGLCLSTFRQAQEITALYSIVSIDGVTVFISFEICWQDKFTYAKTIASSPTWCNRDSSLFLLSPWFSFSGSLICTDRRQGIGIWVSGSMRWEWTLKRKVSGSYLFNEKIGWGMNLFGKEFGMMMGTSLAKINYLITEIDLGLPVPDPFYNY